jgi:superfamily II DNA helicase RecQ
MGEQQEGEDGVGGDAMTGERRGAGKMEYIWDSQATHGSTMARGHYALDVRFPNQLQPEMVANYREISRLWHRFLTWDDRQPEKGEPHQQQEKGKPVRRQEMESPTKEIKKRPLGEFSDGPVEKKRRMMGGIGDDVEKGLRRLVGAHAVWKTEEQREAMEKIIRMGRRDTLIVVLPTGGGKSVLFMLPALLAAGGTSIVVVPFSALMDDIVDRATTSGVDCVRWRPAVNEGREDTQRVAKMVVVSADLAACKEFTMYADSLRARGFLKRIFVDEVHTVIMDVGYRKDLEELKGLHRYDCPVVLLTATMPVRMERWFRRCMLAETADIIRAKTMKRNIRYRVVRVEQSREVPQEVVRVVLGIEKSMTGDQKGVIYCRSKAKCESLAEQLGCDFYHAGMEETARQEVLAKWTDGAGTSRWTVATTALGTGIDIGGMVGIVHMEQPYGLVDFVQQTGRGGRREGEVVESVVVMDQRKAWHHAEGSDIEQMNHQAMEWFVESVDCRRVIIGTFMDGDGRDCAAVGGERCDRCESMVTEVDGSRDVNGEVDRTVAHRVTDERAGPQPNRFRAYVQEQCIGLERLRRWLDSIESDCGVCYVKWHQHGKKEEWRIRYQHRMDQCRVIEPKEYSAWRRQVTFGDYGCCWRCGLPQMWCQELGGTACMYMDKVIPVMMMVGRSERLRRIVKREFDIDAAEEEGYIGWIGRSRRMYGADMTNGLGVWDLIVREVCV